MALPCCTDDLDAVPAELHPFYVHVAGLYVLDLDDSVKVHPTVRALSNAYERNKAMLRFLRAHMRDVLTRMEADAAAMRAGLAQARDVKPESLAAE